MKPNELLDDVDHEKSPLDTPPGRAGHSKMRVLITSSDDKDESGRPPDRLTASLLHQ